MFFRFKYFYYKTFLFLMFLRNINNIFIQNMSCMNVEQQRKYKKSSAFTSIVAGRKIRKPSKFVFRGGRESVIQLQRSTKATLSSIFNCWEKRRSAKDFFIRKRRGLRQMVLNIQIRKVTKNRCLQDNFYY